jgi:tetratricopeptide (TPR) repeat protein
MQGEEQPADGILTRAKLAVDERDFDYARFLYGEALTIDPQNNDARSALHNLRELVGYDDSLLNGIAIAYHSLALMVKYAMAHYDDAIREAEKLLDVSPNSPFALRSILRSAHRAGYSKLGTFIAEKVMEAECAVEDLTIIAKAFLDEKMFDQAAKVAKEIAEIDPENEVAKDILWKSSVEKHMNSDVQLVTADGANRFIPPKVDQEKIFIASHSEKNDAKGGKAAAKKVVKK